MRGEAEEENVSREGGKSDRGRGRKLERGRGRKIERGREFFQELGEGFQVRETNWGKEKIRREEEKKRRRKKKEGEKEGSKMRESRVEKWRGIKGWKGKKTFSGKGEEM